MKVINKSSGLKGVTEVRKGNKRYWRMMVQSKLLRFQKYFPYTEYHKNKAAKLYKELTEELYKDRVYDKGI